MTGRLHKAPKTALRASARALALACACGCGLFTGDEPAPHGASFSTQDALGGCGDDLARAFDSYFDADITREITCLEDRFDDYARYVRREDPSRISKDGLRQFAMDFFPEETDRIQKGLDILFTVNSLFLDAPDETIPIADMGSIFNLLRHGNLAAAAIHRAEAAFRDKGPGGLPLEGFKAVFVSELSSLSRDVLDNITIRSDATPRIATLIDDVLEMLGSYGFDLGPPDRIRLAKRLVAGGSDDTISPREIRTIAGKLPVLADLLFDMRYMGERDDLGGKRRVLFFVGKWVQRAIDAVEPPAGGAPDGGAGDPALCTGDLAREGVLPPAMGNWTPPDVTALLWAGKRRLLGSGEADASCYTHRDLGTARDVIDIALAGIRLHDDFRTRAGIDAGEPGSADGHALFLPPPGAGGWEAAAAAAASSPGLPDDIALGDFVRHVRDTGHPLMKAREARALLAAMPLRAPLTGDGRDSLAKASLGLLVERAHGALPALAGVLRALREGLGAGAPGLRSALADLRALRGSLRRGTGWADEPFLDLGSLGHLAPFVGDGTAALLSKALPVVKRRIAWQIRSVSSPELRSGRLDVPGEHPDFNLNDHSPRDDGWFGSGVVTFHEAANLLDMAEDLLGDLVVSSEMFGLLGELLRQEKNPLRSLSWAVHPSEDSHPLMSPREVRWSMETARGVLTDSKYFRDDEGLATFDRHHHRNQSGFLELVVIRNLCEALLRGYGDGRSLSRGALRTMLFEFKPVLQHLDLWTTSEDTFARNVLLLADLFLHSSDGDSRIDLAEGVEFVSLLGTALTLTDGFLKEPELQRCEAADDPSSLDIECYRKSFFDALFASDVRRSRLPRLHAYVQSLSDDEASGFLANVERFADLAPSADSIARRNLGLLIGTILHIESTVIRYDENGNNVLDPRELDRAFPTYRGVVETIVKDVIGDGLVAAFAAIMAPGGEKGIVRGAYDHMVAHGRPPKGLMEMMAPLPPAATANRDTIAAILHFIATNLPGPQP